MHPAFMHNHYLLKRQFFKLLGQNFRIFDPQGQMVLFSHQKAFKLREDIRIYGDEAKTHELLSIQARQILDFSAAYDVVDMTTKEKVGAFKRKGWTSIIRDKWIVMDSQDREIGTIEEDHVALALVRRFLTALIPQNYDLVMNGRKAVDLKQRFNPFVYHLDVDFGVQEPLIDRRMGIAAGVLLAAVEGRQSG
jgi:uncharacterized protein YxjI